jgi:hypothetical protein
MSGGRNESMLKATSLWEHTSNKGKSYLTNQLGGGRC